MLEWLFAILSFYTSSCLLELNSQNAHYNFFTQPLECGRTVLLIEYRLKKNTLQAGFYYYLPLELLALIDQLDPLNCSK